MTPRIFVLLLFSLPAFAQLPDAPAPKFETQEMPQKFFSRQNSLILSASLGARLTDTIQTCQLLRQRWIITFPDGSTTAAPYFHEDMLPTQSCAGVATWNAASFVGITTASWYLHKKG